MFSEEKKLEFLQKAGWVNATLSPVGDDWALRRFFRLKRGDETAILMQSVPDDDPLATRGHKFSDYVKIDQYLERLGFNVPHIYTEDIAKGLMLVEDFGDISLHELFEGNSPDLKAWYLKATDILIELHQKTSVNDLGLINYYDGHIHAARRFLIDYYLPTVSKAPATEQQVNDYLSVWDKIERSLPPVSFCFVHADYHPHNLMIAGNKIGLIDFQGASWGPTPYDLVNLLEDARRIVPIDIKQACIKRYHEALPENERESFTLWYTVLAGQFHCRVIGQAVKLAEAGKTRLLSYVPILETHLREDLKNPVLEPLAVYLADNNLDFAN